MNGRVEEIEKLVESMVSNVEERGRVAGGRNQVGGANLKEIRSVVEGGKRWFKDVVKNVTLELEIPKSITTHPDGEELFAESLVAIVKKYAPTRRGRSMRVGMNFSSEELLESVGLSFKEMHTLRAADIVNSMSEMSQSNRSPLQLETPQVTVRITYITPPSGSGKRRAFDTAHILELEQFGRKKNRIQDEEGEVHEFLDDEAMEGSEEEEEEDEEEEELDVEEKKRGSSNIMKNNVTTNCLPHALHQALKWSQFKDSKTRERRAAYRQTLQKDGSKPHLFKSVFEAVENLKKEAGITKTENFDWYDVELFQNTVFAGIYQILVFEKTTTTPFFSGPFVAEDRTLVLYLADGHFSGVRSVCNLLKTKYYCGHCLTKYRDAASHYSCRLIHRPCGSKECPTTEEDVPIRCEACQILFRSTACYENHKMEGPRKGKSRCAQTKYCKRCQTSYYINKNRRGHQCGHKYCRRCEDTVPEDHQCVMAISKKNEKKLTRKRCFFDIESKVDEATGKQVPVLFVALRCCQKCSFSIPKTYEAGLKIECEACGPDGRLKIIENITPENSLVNVAEEMTEWIFSEQHKGFVFVAHNASGYDGQFILEQLISSSKAAPEICLEGSKLIYMKHRHVKLIDSLKFLTMSLASVGKAFEIDSLKGDFPVHFIRPENYDYVGAVPDDKFYALENKSADVKAKLLKFLAEERSSGKQFNFYEEIMKYCFNDVYILAASMAIFEKEFETITNVCLFEESVTAASAAIKVFCRNHLDCLTPIVLDAKPSECINASDISQKYLAWIGHKEEVEVQMSTTYGEAMIGEYRVDGFIAKCDKYKFGQILEFNGCYWHGHWCTYGEDAMIGDKTAKEIREEDKKRVAKLEEKFPVRTFWECEVREEMKTNAPMKAFMDDYEAKDILQLSRALVGGRTEVFKLCVPQDGTRYRYVDVVSLYPYVMKHKSFPIGEPHDVHRSTMVVPMTKPEDLTFSGFLKCKVLPPKDLLLPLIPDKSTGKLVFSLCKTCAKMENQDSCQHSDDERSFNGVYTTEELLKALTLGYKVTEVYHGVAYQYWSENENGTGGLFTSYVNSMMVEKIYASGWPKDVNTKEERDAFVKQYKEKENIDLSDHRRFERNPGKRAVAKIMLNSLWGKLAQRVDRETTKVIIEPSKFYKIYYDKTVELLEVRPVNDVLIVRFRQRVETLSSLKTSAMHLAAYVPAYGRLHLYELMEKVGAKNIIYTDTDSIVYGIPPGEEDPLKDHMGEFLGQLTDEVKGEMVDFVSIGAKTYAYKDKDKDGNVKVVRKAKGITLNSAADNVVTFNMMRSMIDEVLEAKKRTVVEVPQFTMRRDRDHQIFSRNVNKKFRFTFNKRRILPDGSTLPFGYV